MDTNLIFSLLIGFGVFITFNSIFEIHFVKDAVDRIIDIMDTLAEHLGRYNTKRYIDRIKKDRIVKQKNNIILKYNRLVEGLIIDFNLPVTLESFTSILCIIFVIITLVIIMFIQNVTMSVVLTISIFIGFLTYFVMQSKLIKAQSLEDIMDAEDIICPLARDGVLVAIKKVMESDEYISPNIRPYFQQFIDNCENNGYSFKQAILLLNKQLGPAFDNFTKKAIVFEYNERKGMADIFLDIVDENAVLRDINARKDRIFRKMNRDFLMKTLIILLFFLYALSVSEFRSFMIFTDVGRIINIGMISIICISFARCQALQGNLGQGDDKN